jgi:hypothetical protein
MSVGIVKVGKNTLLLTIKAALQLKVVEADNALGLNLR